MLESRQVVVYSRKGCHLCEVVKESLAKLSRRGGFVWHEIDVDSDVETRRQFNDEVPVLMTARYTASPSNLGITFNDELRIVCFGEDEQQEFVRAYFKNLDGGEEKSNELIATRRP